MIGIAMDNAESSLPDDNDDDDDAANVLLLVELPPPSPPLPPVPPAPPAPLPAVRTESGDGPFSLPRRRLTRWCGWLGGDARPAVMPSASPPRLRVVFPAPPPPLPRLIENDDEDEEGNDDDDDGDGDGDRDAATTKDADRPLLLTPPQRRWPPPGEPRPETVTTAPTPSPPPNSSSAIPPMCAPPLLSPPPSLSPPFVSWPRNGPIAPAIDFLLPAVLPVLLLPAPSFARLDLGAREDRWERGGAPDFRHPPRCVCPIPPRRNSSLYPPTGGTDAAAADANGILSILSHAPAPVSAPISTPIATPVATPITPPDPPMKVLLDIISRLPKSRMTCVAGEGLVGMPLTMPCMPGMVVPLCMAVVDGGCIVGCAEAPPKVPRSSFVVGGGGGVVSAADARPDVATGGKAVYSETH